MRTFALLLTVLLVAPGAFAIKPEKTGPSVEETVQRINAMFHPREDRAYSSCSDRLQLSLSDDRRQIDLKLLAIDKHDRVIDGIPPKKIYHIRTDSVVKVYPWGKWVSFDRVIVRTYADGVMRYGPIWDCVHKRQKDKTKVQVLDSVDIMTPDLTYRQIGDLVKALNHLVGLLQNELAETPASAPHKALGSQQQTLSPGAN